MKKFNNYMEALLISAESPNSDAIGEIEPIEFDNDENVDVETDTTDLFTQAAKEFLDKIETIVDQTKSEQSATDEDNTDVADDVNDDTDDTESDNVDGESTETEDNLLFNFDDVDGDTIQPDDNVGEYGEIQADSSEDTDDVSIEHDESGNGLRISFNGIEFLLPTNIVNKIKDYQIEEDSEHAGETEEEAEEHENSETEEEEAEEHGFEVEDSDDEEESQDTEDTEDEDDDDDKKE